MTEETDLQTIIVVGQCKGTYANETVTKEFEGKVLMTARPDGAVIVHNLEAGVRPICYIGSGADVSIARNVEDAEIEVFATTDDGQQLTLQFSEVMAIQGIPKKTDCPSLAMAIIKCVFDSEGTYGRTTIARILTGSVSKRVLSLSMNKLVQYGIAKNHSMKEVLAVMDWLIEENYVAYADDKEFPVIVLTNKGLDVLTGGDELPVENKEEGCPECGVIGKATTKIVGPAEDKVVVCGACGFST